MRAGLLWDAPPFGLTPAEKMTAFTDVLRELTISHRRRCLPYRNILDASGFDPAAAYTLQELPFLPVRLFKSVDLCSAPPEEVGRVVTSSGTSGQIPSKIYLDALTADRQRHALAVIVSDFIGLSRTVIY